MLFQAKIAPFPDNQVIQHLDTHRGAGIFQAGGDLDIFPAGL